MKRIIPIVLVLIGVIGLAIAADYTPMSEEDTSGSKTLVALEVNGDITLANDETIDNATDGDVTVTYDDDATTLGEVILKSDNVYSNVADNDIFVLRVNAKNASNESIDYATLQFKIADVTTNTEDGTIIMKIQVNGTDTTIATVDASGLAVVGAVDANNVTVDAGAGIDNAAAGTLLVGAATATKIEVGLTAVETEIQGTLDCVEGVTFQSASFSVANLPTSTNGLSSGAVWLNSNVMTVIP